MAYTIKEAIHVSIVLDGEAVELDYKAGDTDLPQAVADHLVANGFATETSTAKKAAKNPTPADSVEEN